MSNPLLLLIETSTEVCSVALSKGANVISYRVVNEPKSHARIIAMLVEDVLNEGETSIDACDAVVVSEGPGSYTGLRVGVSIAKGLCYGASKPLLAVGSLELLAHLAIEPAHLTIKEEVKSPESVISSDTIIVPMIDARRMEVYTARYDVSCNLLSSVEAMILDDNSFSEELSKGIVIFAGTGAEKFRGIVNHPNAQFRILEADARGMVIPAIKKYDSGDFVDTAYFEPLYLKDFVAGITKKRLF